MQQNPSQNFVNNIFYKSKYIIMSNLIFLQQMANLNIFNFKMSNFNSKFQTAYFLTAQLWVISEYFVYDTVITRKLWNRKQSIKHTDCDLVRLHLYKTWWVDSTLGSLTGQYDGLHTKHVLYRHGSCNF